MVKHSLKNPASRALRARWAFFSHAFALAAILLLFPVAFARAEKITVTTYARAPLVYEYQGKLQGAYIDLWENLARRMGVTEYDYRLVDSAAAVKKIVAEGKADAAFNGVEVTDPLGPHMALAFPFLDVDVRIMVPVASSPPAERIVRVLGGLFFSQETLYIVLALFSLAFLAGLAVFKLERRARREPGGVDNLFHGLWWAIETLTSVGYGDFKLRGRLAKIFGMVFMLIGTCLFAVVVSVLTANLTIGGASSRIRNVEDLRGKRVAMQWVDSGDEKLDALQVTPVLCRTMEEAADAVLSGKADCVVGPTPLLNWYMRTKGRGRFMLAGGALHHAFFGFAVDTRRVSVDKLNQAILGFLRDNDYDVIMERWFGRE